MRICDDLRQAVLQAAIQGKLTKQLPEDGNAVDLLKQIAAEKAKLIKEGKIKKEKALPEISADEVPFGIPDNWKWCYFNHLYTVHNGDRGKNYPSKSTLHSVGSIPFISAVNLDGEKVSVDDKLLYVSENQYNKLRAGKLKKNDMVMCIRGSLGKHGRFQFDKGAIASSLVIIRPINEEMASDYLSIYLDSPLLFSEIKRFDNGTAQPNLAAESLEKFLFPLPPLAEQRRIVARVEELMARIDDLEKTETEMEKLKAAFPGDMKAAQLQAAMQGKLTEQLPDDGDATDLLKQIAAEKARLIKEGKIKKEKTLPPIAPEEIPFDIPENWVWARLGEILSVYGGKRIPVGYSLTDNDTKHKYITVGDMKNGTVLTDKIKYVPVEVFDTIKRYTISSKDVYITVAGTIGRVGEVPTELDGANLTENADKLVFGNHIDKYWLINTLQSSVVQKQISDATTKVGQPKLAIKRIESFIVPLPPLAEQKRIVEKLDKLLPLCDGLVEE